MIPRFKHNAFFHRLPSLSGALYMEQIELGGLSHLFS